MIGRLLLLTLFACGVGCSSTHSGAGVGNRNRGLSIWYDNRGKEQVALRDGVLDFGWHIRVVDPVTSAVKHKRQYFHSRLTPEQMAQVFAWLREYQVLALEPPDTYRFVSRRRRDLGFKVEFSVAFREKEIHLLWNDDDTWPLSDPHLATEALVELCRKFVTQAQSSGTGQVRSVEFTEGPLGAPPEPGGGKQGT